MTVHERGLHLGSLGHEVKGAVDAGLGKARDVVRKHPVKTATAGFVLTGLALAAVGTATLKQTPPPVSAEVSQVQSGTVLPPADLPVVGVLPDQRPTTGAGGEGGNGKPPRPPETGLSGVLTDQPSQPSTEGPAEGGVEGGEGDGSQPPAGGEESNPLAGGGAVEPPVSEPAPELQAARPPVVRRSEVSRELVERYPEKRDGATVIVEKFEVTFSDGQKEFDYVVPPRAGAPPPPPVAAPPPAPAQPPRPQTPSSEASDSCPIPGTVARKSFPEYSIAGGEGISSGTDKLGGVTEKLKNYRGKVESFEKLPRGYRLVIKIKGQIYSFFIMDTEAKNDKELWDKSPHNSGLYFNTLFRLHNTQTRLSSLVGPTDCSVEREDAVTVQVWDRYEKNRFYEMPNASNLVLYR